VDADVIIIGGGLAGLVASNELVNAGKRVAILDQENSANLGGQAFWSLGGLFLVDTPMQRRLRVKDSFELAWQDWQVDGTRIPGLYAAGEAAGFGSGGAHGYNALEGTFLGGCIFTGRTAGRSLGRAL
jgi:predicted oxidoreductase